MADSAAAYVIIPRSPYCDYKSRCLSDLGQQHGQGLLSDSPGPPHPFRADASPITQARLWECVHAATAGS
ncbi:hypothetical protein MRX96_024244 [Rhipicephalus microplus]